MTRFSTPTQEPLVRARYMQVFVALTNALPPSDRHAVRAAVAPETLEAIARGSLLGWLPFAMNLEYTRAVWRVLGDERAHRFFRSLLLGATETTLLAGLVRSALRIAASDPGMYLPWIGKGYDVIFRKCGKMTVTRTGAQRCVMEIRGLPAAALETEEWVRSVASSLSSLTDLVAFDSTVTASAMDPGEGTLRYEATWRVRVVTKRTLSSAPRVLP